MPQLIHDLMFSATFVIILLAILRFGKIVFGTDTYARKNIIIGLSFFSGFSLIQLGGHQGVFAELPLLGETAGRELVEAIGITGGLIFLLSGISSWLPRMVRTNRRGRVLVRRYSCLKMISQSLDQDKPVGEVYERVLQYLSVYLGIPRCAMYTYSTRKQNLRLSNTNGFSLGETGPPENIPLDRPASEDLRPFGRPRRNADGIVPKTDAARPGMAIPIGTVQRLYAVLICWLDTSEADDEFVDFMTSVGSMLSRHIHGRTVQTQKDFYLAQHTLHDKFRETCGHIASVHDLIPGLYKLARESVGVEYLSLATLDGSGENMVRYTIGSTGRMLLEKGVSRRTQGTDVYDVYREGRSMLLPSVSTNDRTGEQDGLFLSCGMRSKVMCPVKAGTKVIAVITVGHIQPGFFTTISRRRMEWLADMVSGVVQRDQLGKTVEAKEDLLLRLQLMQRNLIDGIPVDSFFDQACDVLTRRMNCTMARISLIDRDRSNLKSYACRTIRPIIDNLREKESIPLSLLPWHKLTLDSRKVMLINQDDPESQMQPQESSSALISDIKSAMLVPIRFDDSVEGVISIGEARNWNRRSFGATDLIFAKDVAAKCSLALQMKKMQLDIERGREQVNRLTTGDDTDWVSIRSRIKSPLTSIIGAVELLKTKGPDDALSTKYHDLILRSADRIRTLTDEDYTVEEEQSESTPEMVIG